MCPSYIAVVKRKTGGDNKTERPTLERPLLGCIMANFTVEWLSKSYHTTKESAEDVILRARAQIEDAVLHPKVHYEKILNNEIDELAKESRKQYSPTSPNSELTDELLSWGFFVHELRSTSFAGTSLSCNLIKCSVSLLDSCGYTSGSESEVGDDSEGEGAQQRRMRTKFTSEQVSKLENTFSKHKYLGATQRRKIAEKLKLSETQVSFVVMAVWEPPGALQGFSSSEM